MNSGANHSESSSRPFGKKLVVLAIAVGLAVSLVLFTLSHKDGTQKGVRPSEPHPSQASSKNQDPVMRLGSVIKSVKLHPPLPTRLDTLKVEVFLQATDSGNPPYNYSYTWECNKQVIPNASAESLDLADFNNNDIISVIVTPSDGENTGFPVNSPYVTIHSIPLSLELETLHHKPAVGNIIVLQLVSSHPDSKEVMFSLAPPFVPGMNIDQNTGQIRWAVQTASKGVIRFGAVVEDKEKTVKVTKVFEVIIE